MVLFPFALMVVVAFIMLYNTSSFAFKEKILVGFCSVLLAQLCFYIIYFSIGYEIMDFLDSVGLPNIIIFPVVPAFLEICSFKVMHKIVKGGVK